MFKAPNGDEFPDKKTYEEYLVYVQNLKKNLKKNVHKRTNKG